MITNLDDYKQHVLQVAKRVKEENGWCADGFAEVMKELEIELPPELYSITVTVEITVDAEVADTDRLVTESFIEQSVIDASLDFDGDWDNASIEDWNIKHVEFKAITD